MKSENKKTGALAEEIAATFLKQKGFEIVSRNFCMPWGEIDIIAKKSGIWHFVEVKSVVEVTKEGISREMSHSPEDNVNARKLAKIQKTAEYYLNRNAIESDSQIDIVAVFLDLSKKKARCRILGNVQ